MYKQVKALQPSGKMHVTPEQSEAVQKVLFEMGYVWLVDKKKLQRDSHNYLYWYYEPKKHIMYGTSFLHFDIHENPLHIFTDYFTTEPLK